MSDFSLLLETCKAQAILDKLESTELSVYRSLCRDYSKRFHTELIKVYFLPPEEVLLEVFSSQLDEYDLDEDLEDLLEKIYSLEDPEYESQKEDELKSFIKKAELEEEERIEKGKPIHKAMDDEPTLKSLPEKTIPRKFPSQGGVDLSRLEAEENPYFGKE